MDNAVTEKPFFAYRLPYGESLFHDWETLEKIAGAGVDLIAISPMNTANNAGDPYSPYPPVWRWDESYDWDSLEQQFRDVDARHPRARFLVGIDLNTPLWLARNLRTDSFHDLSEISLNPRWQELTLKYLRAFIDYCEKHWPGRVYGYVLACGATMEWLEYGAAAPGRLKSAHYRDYCRTHGWEELPAPTYEEIGRGEHGYIRDPQREKHITQWLRYCNSLVADLAGLFISTARECTRENEKIGVFYGYLFDQTANGHLECEQVFADPATRPDFVIAAACNQDRELGHAGGHAHTYHLLKRHGISFVHEIDRITSTTALRVSKFINYSGGIWEHWQNTAEDIAGMHREMAMTLIHGHSLWWFNIWGQSYASAEVRAEIANMRRVWEENSGRQGATRAEILFVFDPESIYHIASSEYPEWPEFQNVLGHKLRHALSAAGYPWDTAVWNDLPHIDLSQYRMVIFQNLVVTDAARRELLREKICTNGRTVLWSFAAGIIADGVYDEKNVEALTGCPYGGTEMRRHDFPEWHSAYCGDPRSLTAEALKKLMEEAGLYRPCPGGAFWRSENLLMVHRVQGGKTEITLPRPAEKITELFSGREITVGGDRFTDDFASPDTKLYRLG